MLDCIQQTVNNESTSSTVLVLRCSGTLPEMIVKKKKEFLQFIFVCESSRFAKGKKIDKRTK